MTSLLICDILYILTMPLSGGAEMVCFSGSNSGVTSACVCACRIASRLQDRTAMRSPHIPPLHTVGSRSQHLGLRHCKHVYQLKYRQMLLHANPVMR
jgi:hypothetical protein